MTSEATPGRIASTLGAPADHAEAMPAHRRIHALDRLEPLVPTDAFDDIGILCRGDKP